MEGHEEAIRAQACHNLSQAQCQDTAPPSSDKENAGPAPPRLPAPTYLASRPLLLANGAQASPKAEAKAEEKESEMEVEVQPVFGLCSANPETCPVHSSAPNRHRWYFFHKAEQLPPLLAGLNPRGHRERRLRSALNTIRTTLETSLKSCPVSRLNPSLGALQVSSYLSYLYLCGLRYTFMCFGSEALGFEPFCYLPLEVPEHPLD